MTRYACCDERRRDAVKAHATLNGIDYVEVIDDPALPDAERQRALRVGFVKALNLGPLGRDNFRVEGGERRTVRVLAVTPMPGNSTILRVTLDRPGDFSSYTLRLVAGPSNAAPPPNFDPQLAAVDFSFKVNCPSNLDCRVATPCPQPPRRTPVLDYLAKDFESFRRLMLDRMTLVTPEWTERNIADLGVTLVELFAYVGDYLSYEQDAIATEAYLGTARRRVSVRRHARLVDYRLDEGRNARTFVQVTTDREGLELPEGTPVLSRTADKPARIQPGSSDFDEIVATGPIVFETRHEQRLYSAHNRLRFYTWGSRECCLPKGATSATLYGALADLQPADVLVFQEVLGPRTGLPEDAELTHRCAVRLTAVTPSSDPLGGRFATPPSDAPVPVTEITWADADALPFPLCVSARLEREDGSEGDDIDDVSVALGNVVLADHGSTVAAEDLGEVPAPKLSWAAPSASCQCDDPATSWVPPRFRPQLEERPLTHAAPYLAQGNDASNPRLLAPPASASAALYPEGRAVPVIALTGVFEEQSSSWSVQEDLLASEADGRDFVVEIESDFSARVRFGDGRFGARPASGTRFQARYRVGNGAAGNVGASALGHVVLGTEGVLAVTNPLPALGGTAPEAVESARQNAPSAFLTQERAVTPEDYETLLLRDAQVQRAAATFRWTGSWYTVFPSIDRRGGQAVDGPFKTRLRRELERYRLAGHDIELNSPRFVPLAVTLHVCVARDAFRRHVLVGLLDALSSGVRSDGSLGPFHPDRLTFGQSVYVSPIVAAAQSVPGVDAVKVQTFRRQATSDAPPEDGELKFGRLEIAELMNDPNFPDRGLLQLELEGGK